MYTYTRKKGPLTAALSWFVRRPRDAIPSVPAQACSCTYSPTDDYVWSWNWTFETASSCCTASSPDRDCWWSPPSDRAALTNNIPAKPPAATRRSLSINVSRLTVQRCICRYKYIIKIQLRIRIQQRAKYESNWYPDLKTDRYPLATTSNSELATRFGATGTAISSTQVTYNACAAGFGNSLNLQSVAGKCAVPDIALEESVFFFI